MTVARTRVRVKRWKRLPNIFRVGLRVTRFNKIPPEGVWFLHRPYVDGVDQAAKLWMVENLA